MNKAIELLKGFSEFTSGKKTYIIGILMIILGFMTDDNQMVLTGLGFMTLRKGLQK